MGGLRCLQGCLFGIHSVIDRDIDRAIRELDRERAKLETQEKQCQVRPDSRVSKVDRRLLSESCWFPQCWSVFPEQGDNILNVVRPCNGLPVLVGGCCHFFSLFGFLDGR